MLCVPVAPAVLTPTNQKSVDSEIKIRATPLACHFERRQSLILDIKLLIPSPIDITKFLALLHAKSINRRKAQKIGGNLRSFFFHRLMVDLLDL